MLLSGGKDHDNEGQLLGRSLEKCFTELPACINKDEKPYHGWIEISFDTVAEKLILHKAAISTEANKTVKARLPNSRILYAAKSSVHRAELLVVYRIRCPNEWHQFGAAFFKRLL